MLDTMDSDTYKGAGSITHDSVAPVAIELALAYMELDKILGIAFAKTAYDEYLEMIAEIHGIYRKDGIKASGSATFAGAAGTKIQLGTLLQTDSGLKFYTTESKYIDDLGSASVAIEAEAVGELYNIPSNVLKLPVQITGVDSVSNEALQNGTDREEDSLLRERLLEKVRQPPLSGSKSDYIRWAKEIDDVAGCIVTPLHAGPGTIKLTIYGENGMPLSEGIIAAVKNHIDPADAQGDGKAPIGALVTVVTVATKQVNIAIAGLQLEADYSLVNVQADISAAINQYITSVLPGETVVVRQLESIIMSIAGVYDFAQISVNGEASNISTTTEEKAVLGAVTFE